MVITKDNLDTGHVDADTAAEIDVEGVAGTVFTILIIFLFAGGNTDAEKAAADFAGGLGDQTILEDGAAIDEHVQVAAQVELVVHVHGNVEGNLGIAELTAGGDTGEAVRTVGAIEQAGSVQTGGYAQTGDDGNVVIDAYVEAVEVVLVRIATIVGSGFCGIQIAGADGELGVGLGSHQQQGCRENSYKNLLHYVISFVKRCKFTNF